MAQKARMGSRELDEPVERFASPILHSDSASTTHFASPASTLMYAGKQLHWATQADTHWTAAYNLASVSGKATSLFTHSGGIQAFAGNGKVSVQAHTDDLEILADQEVVVTSSKANITINAAKKITLQAGQSSITLDGPNITFACPGTFTVKSSMHAFKGPASKAASLAPLPGNAVNSERPWWETPITPVSHVQVNPETDIVNTIGTIDTGNVGVNIALGVGASAVNVVNTAVNGLMNGLSLPAQIWAEAKGMTLEQAENDMTATAASTGPLAPFMIMGTLPAKAPRAIRKGAGALDGLADDLLSQTRKSLDKVTLPKSSTGGFIDPNVVDKIKDVSRKPAISSDGKVIPYGKTEADAITIRNKRNLDADGYLTKGDQKLKYDDDGFPVFDSKYDTVLDDAHFGTQNDYAHFQAANESLARQIKSNPALANEMGLTQQQVKFLEKAPAEGIAPPGLTWHHHQDLGRMQLVDDVQHKTFKHTGGMSIWGGGYK